MEPKTTFRAVVILGFAMAISGCVDPGHIDPTALYRYQQYIAAGGAQDRLADDPLRPAPGSTGLPLKTETDPATGRTLIKLTLTEVVHRTLRNNLTINIAGYNPALAREDVVAAAAAFDARVTSSLSLERFDRRTATSILANKSKTVPFELGLIKRLTTGGEASLQYGVTKSDSRLNNLLNPAYIHSAAFELTHPLLRDAGRSVTLATLRVARVNHDISLTAFKSNVLDVVDEVQGLYWQLMQAREELEIQLSLLTWAIDTQRQVRGRSDIDAHKVLQAQATSAVEVRRAGVVQARQSILDVQDRLVRAMADASITMLDDFDLVPVTLPLVSGVTVNTADQVATALKYSPELAQTRLAVRINEIGVSVARNQIRPRLDLTGRAGLNGLGPQWDKSWNEMRRWDYIDYSIGLAFEWPIYNRERLAGLRRARYDRAKSIATMQDMADQVAIAVRIAVREIQASQEELQAHLKAQAAVEAKLDALDVRQELQDYTPEYFNLRLEAQREVATARSLVLSLKVDLNRAVARLARVTGTSLQGMGVRVTDAETGVEIIKLLMEGANLSGRAAPVAPPE